MTNENEQEQHQAVPEHLGGNPDSFIGWVKLYLSWLFFNILYGFPIVVAAVAAWLPLKEPANNDTIVAIYNSLALSVLVWATTVMLSSADFQTVFNYIPRWGAVKAVLTAMTILILIVTVVVVAMDPPEWRPYLKANASNDRLLSLSIWGTVGCLALAGGWFYVHRIARAIELSLHDMGFHDEQRHALDEIAKKAREKKRAGGLKIN